MTRPWLSVRPPRVGAGEELEEANAIFKFKAILFPQKLRGLALSRVPHPCHVFVFVARVGDPVPKPAFSRGSAGQRWKNQEIQQSGLGI